MPGRETWKQIAFFGALLAVAGFMLHQAFGLDFVVRGTVGPGLYPALVLAALLLATVAVLIGLLLRREIVLLSPFLEGLRYDTLLRRLAAGTQQVVGRPVRILVRNGSGVFSTLHAGRTGVGGDTIAVVASESPDLTPHEAAAYVREHFVPVAGLFFEPDALVVRADAPWHDLAAFFAEAGGRPLRVGFAVDADAAAPTTAWLGRYGSPAEAIFGEDAKALLAALAVGAFDAVVVPLDEAAGAISQGEARGLAVLSDAPADDRGLAPRATEQGYPLASGAWGGLALPRHMADPAVCERLHRAFSDGFGRYRRSGERQEGDAAWSVQPPEAFRSFLTGFAGFGPSGSAAPALPAGQVAGFGAAIAALLLFPWIMELLGFPLAAFLFLAGLMALLWPRLDGAALARIIAVSAALSFGLHQLFWKTFYVVFPEGMLFGG